MDKDKQTFTIEEAAELLTCHPETLRREIRAGRLKAAKIGRDYRISRFQLTEYWRAAGGGELFGDEKVLEPDSQTAEDEVRSTRFYMIDPDLSDTMERADKIALMMQLRRDGLEYQQIADEMMRRGIKTSRGHSKWHKGSVHAMLRKYL
ncbi:MAG TPA: excisionase family DNA-binding protein [Nitrososphaerales archaeon]|nr:excisionase family DNA-binding protein [Nitrososphaerales archaeon]